MFSWSFEKRLFLPTLYIGELRFVVFNTNYSKQEWQYPYANTTTQLVVIESDIAIIGKSIFTVLMSHN